MKKLRPKMFFLFLLLLLFIVGKLYLNTDHWSNWGETQACQPAKYFYPENKQDLINAIKQAKINKKSIHAFGSSHSWSDIVCSDYLINTAKLNKILNIDKNTNQVTVEAGMKLYDLNKQLAKAGLALPNLGKTASQSIAGLTATATHGSGQTGTTSSFITEIELITADGQTHILSLSSHPDEFAAARTSLGALGVVYSLKLQCVPLFKLVSNSKVSDWDTVSKHYKEIYAASDYFSFSLNPYTGKVLENIMNKTELPINTNKKWDMFVAWLVIGRSPGYMWFKLLDFFPTLTPRVTDKLYAYAQKNNIVDYSYNQFVTIPNAEHEVIYKEEEIAIPIDSLPQAIDDVRHLISKYSAQNFYVAFWGVVVRFAKADSYNLLSPAEGRDTAYISITSSRFNEDFYREFGELMLKYQGRPHWGKINFLTRENVQALYRENVEKFEKIRNEFDPENTFTNPFVLRIFGKAHTP